MYYKDFNIRVSAVHYGEDAKDGRLQVKIAHGWSGPSFEVEIPANEVWEIPDGGDWSVCIESLLLDRGRDLVRFALEGAVGDILHMGREEIQKKKERADREAEEHMTGFGE